MLNIQSPLTKTDISGRLVVKLLNFVNKCYLLICHDGDLCHILGQPMVRFRRKDITRFRNLNEKISENCFFRERSPQTFATLKNTLTGFQGNS